jgi:hypothetical protein
MEKEILLASIESKIIVVRGVQVILDSELARLYGVATKVLNQAVKRNHKRFPESFMFKLTFEESQFLRSQFVTLKTEPATRGSHMKYSPQVYTELGIAMLSSVLNSESAIQVNIEIIQVFVQLRRNLRSENFLHQRLDGLEKKLIHHELKFDEIMETIQTRVPETKGIFFNDQIFDAYVFSSELIASAKKSIVLLDNYIDESTLLQLSKRQPTVSCMVYTEKVTNQLRLDLEKHNAQYPEIEIRVKKHFHDRFLIIDEQEMYHLGASLKDLGKRWFAFSRMDELLDDVMRRLV